MGEAYFAATIGAIGGDAAIADNQCAPSADPAPEAPSNICSSMALTEVISTPTEEDAIYTIPPVTEP